MKVIKFPKFTTYKYDLHYPVGDNIKDAMKWVKLAAAKFKRIEVFKNESVNVWCRGSSGAILATLFISYIPNNSKLLHVKKEYESSHGTSDPLFGAINVIIDDFIAEGETLIGIENELANHDYEVHCLIISNGIRKKAQYINQFEPDYLITQT